jgi:hypothetical protein
VRKSLHENVEHAQKKQKKVYVARKGLQTLRGFKPLKALLKIPKSRCANLEKRDHCLVTRRDPTSLLITKMARDFRNKIMAAKCVFSKISRGSVGND